MDEQAIHHPPRKSGRRLRQISAVTGAGLLAGLIAAGLGGVASAQTVIADDVQPAQRTLVVRSLAQVDDDPIELEDDYELSTDEEAAFDRFDQCLRDAGIDIEEGVDVDSGAAIALDGTASDSQPDDAALDDALESCEPLLEEIEGFAFAAGFSAEDDALFEQFDACLENAGIDFESEVDLDDAAVDAAFESCDPILDGLSEDAQVVVGGFADLSAEDEAVFEQFDACLESAGVDFESEVDLDDAAFEAAFESCDPILDGLSEDAQAIFDCPEHE